MIKIVLSFLKLLKNNSEKIVDKLFKYKRNKTLRGVLL